MKNRIKTLLIFLAYGISLSSCQKEFEYKFADKGPELNVVSYSETAYMGGEISFSVSISDSDFALSTLKAELYFDADKVSETVIRTKENGTYEGEVQVPFQKNIGNGQASLVLTGQNVGQATTETSVAVDITRPQFEYLTLLVGDQTYRMDNTEGYEYAVTGDFPSQCEAKIVSSAVPGTDNEITFGWNGSEIAVDGESEIPFSNSVAGYTITFNTFSFEASPFITIYVNGKETEMVDGNNYAAVIDLKQNETIQITGYDAGFSGWTIDPDFIEEISDSGEYRFLPVDGKYKVNIDFENRFFRFEAMKSDTELAVLNADGTGAIWLIGDQNVGKPTMAQGASWNPEAGGLCLSQIEPKKHQITLVAGVQLSAEKIDFKFFNQKTWDHGEFNSTEEITTTSSLITIGEDSGNIALADGVKLEMGGIYRFVIDLTQATSEVITNDKGNEEVSMKGAVLSVEKVGDQEIPEQEITVNGQKMEMVTPSQYSVTLDLEQSAPISITGLADMASYYLDPDYLTLSGTGVSFAATTGKYRIDLYTDGKYARFNKVTSGGDAATFNDGAIWLLGYGLGYPYNKDELGWDNSNAYCVAEVAPKVFQFTGIAVEQGDNTVPGGKIRYDYFSIKYYCDKAWHGETGTVTFADGAGDQLEQSGGETNIKLKGEGDKQENPEGVVHLEKGATYRFTFDLTGCSFDGDKLSGEQRVSIEKL